jgi:hypothetical protein
MELWLVNYVARARQHMLTALSWTLVNESDAMV